MMYAYMRISTLTHDQTTENQRLAILEEVHHVDEWVVEEGVSGSIKALDRPAFAAMMQKVQAGDQVCCTMVDRLGRTASDVLHTVEEFKRLKVKLRVIQLDGIDVTSSMGKLVLTVMAACAELEKNLLVERTIMGMKRTRDEGTILGSRYKIHPDAMYDLLEMREGGATFDEIAEKHQLPRSTIASNITKWSGRLDTYKDLYYKQKQQIEANKFKKEKK